MRRRWLNKLNLLFRRRPPLNYLLWCLVCAIMLIALWRSSSSNAFDSVTFGAKQDVYNSYRRLREQATSDYLDLKSLSRNTDHIKDFDLCNKEKENYVPCYNVSANLLSGLINGEEFDRHCEISRDNQQCFVRPPKEYKIPLSWPAGRDIIWSGNVKLTKEQFLSSGSMTKRLMLLEENQISFRSDEGLIFDGVKDYSNLIAELIGLGGDHDLFQAGVHTVLDIGCGFGSFGARLLSLNMMAVCMAAYELTGSQVQLALERGLPAIIGSFISKQLPFPSLSYDMIHCAQCGILWDDKDGNFLIEVDRLLKPGGYIVLTSPESKQQENTLFTKKVSTLSIIEQFAEKLCWNLLGQQEETSIWQKTIDSKCYITRKDAITLCEGEDDQLYYKPLKHCVSGTTSKRWIPVSNKSHSLTSDDLEVHGVRVNDFSEDLEFWKSNVISYWSLLSPIIFSDHPKRPGDDDPLLPYNMIRNVMDMNAHYGGLNAALLEAGKSVSVMNVVPFGMHNTLPLILARSFAGVLHDWCEPFPTYPRTYDMLHANGLISHLTLQKCSTVDLFFEMDRILRPEGWILLSDRVGPIEQARMLAIQMRWETRVIDPENGTEQRLLICQKPFIRK